MPKIPHLSRQFNEKPLIIGFGPAGMFAALELIERGLKPLIFEQGKRIEERSIDIQRFIGQRVLDTESNFQFGEGGAGAYSDGKLFSKIKNNSKHVTKVFDTFIKFGAPKDIGIIQKPHLGTDVLIRIVKKIREYILESGCEIHYGSKLTHILVSGGKAAGVVINNENEYNSSRIYLAIGHSARDTFEMLHKKGICLEQKPISVGLRIEHPVKIINSIRRAGEIKDPSSIEASNYSFTYMDRKAKRGVHTFCMCPGGEIVNASSENGLLVLNGMSYSTRSSAYSNSALVVTCNTEDYTSPGPLAGIEFQRAIELKAFIQGGGKWHAPAQNLIDFMLGRISSNLNANSYKMGVVSANLKDIFPQFIIDMLFSAFNYWKKEYPLFVSEEAILLGAETRTSCPLIIKRNDAYESENTENLFPIGEGSGYAGGITSSAADAIKAVEASIDKT
ncbi:MAG: dehydrogenase [Elusimicrobia bacterium]|nr:dehydrogenase [Candidatus Liberimonas magnetica]